MSDLVTFRQMCERGGIGHRVDKGQLGDGSPGLTVYMENTAYCAAMFHFSESGEIRHFDAYRLAASQDMPTNTLGDGRP